MVMQVIFIGAIRRPHPDVGILQEEPLVDIAADGLIGAYNILDLDIQEVVVGVNMLLNETFYFKKGR